MNAPKSPHEVLLEHVTALIALEAHAAARLVSLGTGMTANDRDGRRAACRLISAIAQARTALSDLEAHHGVVPR